MLAIAAELGKHLIDYGYGFEGFQGHIGLWWDFCRLEQQWPRSLRRVYGTKYTAPKAMSGLRGTIGDGMQCP